MTTNTVTAEWLTNNVPPPHLLHSARAIAPKRGFTTPQDMADFLAKSAKKDVLAALRAEYFYPSSSPVRWYKAESAKPQTAMGLLETVKKNLGYSEQTALPKIPAKSIVPVGVLLETGLVQIDFVGRTKRLTYEANFKSQTVFPDEHFTVFIHPDSLIIEVFAHASFRALIERLKQKAFPGGPLRGFCQYVTKKNDVLASIKRALEARKFKAWTESASRDYDKEGKEIVPERDLDSIPGYRTVYGAMQLYRATLSFDVQHADGYLERGVQFRYNSTKDEIAFSRCASRTAITVFRNAVISIAGMRHV